MQISARGTPFVGRFRVLLPNAYTKRSCSIQPESILAQSDRKSGNLELAEDASCASPLPVNLIHASTIYAFG